MAIKITNLATLEEETAASASNISEERSRRKKRGEMRSVRRQICLLMVLKVVHKASFITHLRCLTWLKYSRTPICAVKLIISSKDFTVVHVGYKENSECTFTVL